MFPTTGINNLEVRWVPTCLTFVPYGHVIVEVNKLLLLCAQCSIEGMYIFNNIKYPIIVNLHWDYIV